MSTLRLTFAAVLITAVVGVAIDLALTDYLGFVLGRALLDTHRSGLVPPRRSLVLDASGGQVGSLGGADAVREPVDMVPAVFRDVLVRWEDARYGAHDGIDRQRMVGALAALLGGDPQGGSTITMQLAKLVKCDSARTVRRKLEDMALALAMDARLGKEAVLLSYVNHAYFGSGAYGLGEACRYYFDRPRCDGLELHEAAYLVSLLRAPAELSRDEPRALARRNAVLDQLREPEPLAENAPTRQRWARAWHRFVEHFLLGRIELEGRYSSSQLQQARARPLGLVRRIDPPSHPFVLELVRQELQKRLGPAIYADGFAVRLAIDPRVQRAAEHALAEGLRALRTLQKRPADADDDLDGGVLVIDPRTGNLLAYVPGADFHRSQVPFAARPIQVGSSLKPFVYSEFLEQGRGDLDTLLPDAPICVGGWCPHNYDGKYHGPVTVAFALSHSLNTVAVRVAQSVGVDSITSRLRLLGVRSPLTSNLPMALGASELTLFELGAMYASLYDGHVVRPRLVLEVRDREGQLRWQAAAPDRPLAYQPTTIAALHEAMAGVLESGGTASVLGRSLAKLFERPGSERLGGNGRAPAFACKTGTHDGFTRVGIGCVASDSDVGPVAIVTYIGHRTPRPLGEGFTGGRIAGPVVASIMESITTGSRARGDYAPFPAAEPLAASGQEDPRLEPATDTPFVDGTSASIDTPSAAEPVLQPPAEVEIVAPPDWAGRSVLDADVIDARGPRWVQAYLEQGGREEELAEVASLLGLTIERRVVHGQRLLGPGFSDRPLAERVALLARRMAASLARMRDADRAPRSYDAPEVRTERMSEADGDRRVERIYRYARGFQRVRITRHRGSGRVLLVECVTDQGARHAFVRRGDEFVSLTSLRVEVRRGSLEHAWIAAGLSPSSLESVRALGGERLDVDRIPRGFRLDLLLSEGRLLGLDARIPDSRTRGRDRSIASYLVEGVCLSDDGAPCGRRLAPVPLSEARVYHHLGAGPGGHMLIQRDRPGRDVVAPIAGRVGWVAAEHGRLVLAGPDGLRLRMDGVRCGVAPDSELRAGEKLGTLDDRGALVLRAGRELDGRAQPVSIAQVLAPVDRGSDELRSLATHWRGLHAWLRGEGPEARPLARHAPIGL